MHNLKKVVAVIAVLAMVLGTMVTGFAATVGLTPAEDIAGTEYADAAARLQALGVMIGYPDGTFKPGNPVTRTEFATTVDRVLGLESAAKLAGGTKPAFSDVNADYQWAWGYINTAASNGIVNGYPDGTFKPGNQVTFAEAAAMLVRALGYEPSVAGVWPTNYLSKAAELGILDGVNATPDGAATRGDVALMVDNSLEVGLMERSTYGDTAEYEVTDKTLLTDKLNIEKIEGRVVETPSVNSSLDAEVVIDPDDEDLKEETYGVVEAINPDALLGLDVTAWVNDDDDVFYVEYDESQVKKDALDGVDAKGEEVTLYVADDDFDVADDAVFYVNGDKVTDLDDLADLLDEEGTIYGNFVFDNDEVVFANLQQFGEVDGDLVKEVNKDDEIITTYDKDANEDEIDLTDPDAYVITDAAGAVLTLDDVKANDVVYVADYDDTYHVVLVKNEVTGKLGSVKDDEVEIGDESYDIVADYSLYSLNDGEDVNTFTGAGDLSDATDEDVTAKLDLKNQVKFLTSAVNETSDDLFGVVTKVDTLRDEVKVFYNDSEKFYEVAGDIYVGDKEEDIDALEDYVTTVSKYAIVKFDMDKDGNINDIYVLGGVDSNNELVSDKSGDGFEAVQDYLRDLDDTHDRVEIGDAADGGDGEYYYVSDSTAIVDDINDMDAVAWDDIKGKDAPMSGNNYTAQAVVVTDDKYNANFIVFTNGFDQIAEDEESGVVLDKFIKSGDWYATVAVYDGEETDYKLDSKNDVEVGDIVNFTVNSSNELKVESINSGYTTGKVTGKSSGKLEIGNHSYRTDSATLVFDFNSKMELDSIDTAKLSDVKVGDKIGYVVDSNVVKFIYIGGPTLTETTPTKNIAITFDPKPNNNGDIAIDSGDTVKITIDNADTLLVNNSPVTVTNGVYQFTPTIGESYVVKAVNTATGDSKTVTIDIVEKTHDTTDPAVYGLRVNGKSAGETVSVKTYDSVTITGYAEDASGIESVTVASYTYEEPVITGNKFTVTVKPPTNGWDDETNYQFNVTAADNAGNDTTESITVKFDVTAAPAPTPVSYKLEYDSANEELKVMLLNGDDESDFVILIGTDAYQIEDGVVDVDDLTDGRLYTATLYNLDDLDTPLASKNFIK